MPYCIDMSLCPYRPGVKVDSISSSSEDRKGSQRQSRVSKEDISHRNRTSRPSKVKSNANKACFAVPKVEMSASA